MGPGFWELLMIGLILTVTFVIPIGLIAGMVWLVIVLLRRMK